MMMLVSLSMLTVMFFINKNYATALRTQDGLDSGIHGSNFYPHSRGLSVKLVIAGGRDYFFSDEDTAKLDALHAEHSISEVVCGCASGADSEGAAWAATHGIFIAEFPADWQQFGRSAGPRRNQQMAAYADALALFPGGTGSANMLLQAQQHGLKIFDFRS